MRPLHPHPHQLGNSGNNTMLHRYKYQKQEALYAYIEYYQFINVIYINTGFGSSKLKTLSKITRCLVFMLLFMYA